MTDNGQQVYDMKFCFRNLFRSEWHEEFGPVPDFMQHKSTDKNFDVDHTMDMPHMKPDKGLDLLQTHRRLERWCVGKKKRQPHRQRITIQSAGAQCGRLPRAGHMPWSILRSAARVLHDKGSGLPPASQLSVCQTCIRDKRLSSCC